MQSNPVRPERRQLTILFSDIVGSSALSQQLDPEDLRDLIRVYQNTCTSEIERFDGTVTRYVGDGILALFGYPRAHEDDAERAVNAGLAIVDKISSLDIAMIADSEIRLAVRVGIATGLVVAGDYIGKGPSEEAAVIGETPNLAARLQQNAEPNSVVIHDTTKELVGTRFKFLELKAKQFSGFAAPVRVWQVLSRAPVRSRFEAAHPADLAPLVGRESNLLAFLERWKLATQGKGQVILLAGEAGIGKSRIAQAFDERLETKQHDLVRYQCSSYHLESALRPFIEQLEWAAGMTASDTPLEKLGKLEQLVKTSDLDVSFAVPLLASQLSLSDGDRYPVEPMSSQQRKERTLKIFVDRLRSLSAKKPLLVIFEDAHWADPTSLELVQRIFDAVKTERILFIVTFRPEFHPPWTPGAHISQMVLERLTLEQATDLAKSVLKDTVLPPSLIQQIVVKTDGVPLFIEEVTKTVKASQAKQGAPHTGTSLTVPTTIRDTLAARLDQLAEAKELAQLGAVIGRSFSHTLLAAAANVPLDDLNIRLSQVVGSGLLYEEGDPPHTTYSFKHALVQDAAYESLLRSERRELHGRIADVLVGQFPEFSRSQPEVVAHHCAEAARFTESAQYWLAAGKAAIERSANVEAAADLRSALSALERIPDRTEAAKLELPIQLTLGVALTASEGFASPSVETAYARARLLCDAAGDAPGLFYVLCGLGSFYTVRANLHAALEIAQRMLELGRATQNVDLLVWGHVAVGVTRLNLGELRSARMNLEEGLSIYSVERHGHHAFLFGQDAGVIGRCHLAWATWLAGDPPGALREMALAIDLAQRLSHAFSRAYALTFGAWLAQFMGALNDCSHLADAAIVSAKEQRFPLLLGMAMVVKGWTITENGDAVLGLETVREGIALYRKTGAELGMPAMLALLAAATVRSGDIAGGLRDALEARELANRNNEHLFQAELYRLIAEVTLIMMEHHAEAEQLAMREEAKREATLALAIATRQGARTLMLRAALTNVRAALNTEDRTHALGELSEIFKQFDINSSLLEVQQARLLIDQAN